MDSEKLKFEIPKISVIEIGNDIIATSSDPHEDPVVPDTVTTFSIYP